MCASCKAEIANCSICGKEFIIRRMMKEMIANSSGFSKPEICYKCYLNEKASFERKLEEKEAEEYRKHREKDKKRFERQIYEHGITTLDKIDLTNENTLFILGNGFDLMHRVDSGYYSFRDSLNKNGELYQMLDTILTEDDIWNDFENALAHYDVSAMASEDNVDFWLDVFDAYDPDSQVADYYMAIESAARPLGIISSDLPKAFRKWVEKLFVGTDDRPLKALFKDTDKILNFNYTEFVETMYDIPRENICYIHGCRRKIKGQPKERLILGHMPQDELGGKEFDGGPSKNKRSKYRRAFIDVAQENILRMVDEYDDYITKHCDEIIENHIDFFSSLDDVSAVVTIGHSLSEVDEHYFREIKYRVKQDTKWYFGVYGADDVERMWDIVNRLDLFDHLKIFRTNNINTTPNEEYNNKQNTRKQHQTKEKIICSSQDKETFVSNVGDVIYIKDKSGNTLNEISVMSPVKRATFISNDKLLVICRGEFQGILLFTYKDNKWTFVDELQSIPYQNLINPRLRAVYVRDDEIVFVYNNHERYYSLNTGELTNRKRRRYSETRKFRGYNIINRLL